MVGRCALDQLAVIVAIHHQDVVETLEILVRHLAPAQPADIRPAPRNRLLRARIGRRADVVGVGTGGIHFHMPIEAGLLEGLAQHALRHRRPTDIAHADHQHLSNHFIPY